MKMKPQRTCPSCGNELSGAMEFCPVCMLRNGLAGGVEPGESSLDEAAKSVAGQAAQRFEHYELVQGEDGKAVELGRGAMGVTYKAFDVDLHCPVTLKVISERYLRDEAARLRFLREARAAASVRHPNVALVFHLGRTGQNYFYAMEFVEGETLENLIKRSGRLEVKLALEIATQVAAGLAAVHKQKLVHRDIKPSNIMVSFEEGNTVTARIIDLGLAKLATEPDSQAEISTPGMFVGTPEFASPEQFAGLDVDIRSDLYSLGVTLWVMVTGHALFRGSPVEAMYQHQHVPLPVERLKGVPQPVVVLLEILLEKDPAQRFRTPNELQKSITTVMRAVETRRTVDHQKLRLTFARKPGFQSKKLPSNRVPKRSIGVLPFASLSADKTNAYFADGVQDEILFNLAKVSQLKVISRTSVMTYRPGDNRNLHSIAESLGVANVVEGTVRRDGNRVRITIRLINARNDKTIWADSYDRDLNDIFAIQSEVAQTIANKLTVTLSPKEKQRIAEKPTENLKAYDLYLQAKLLVGEVKLNYAFGNFEKKLRSGVDLLERAVHLDPKFTLAYCASAEAHDLLYLYCDPTSERHALGDAAMNDALRLQPELPEVHLTYAFHLYRIYRDYERARAQLVIARRGLPNDAGAFVLQAYIDRREGNFHKAIQELNEAVSRDPRNTVSLEELAFTLHDTRQFRAAEQVYDRLIGLAPDQPMLKVQKASVTSFMETGDYAALRAAIAALPASLADDRTVLSLRLGLALADRDGQQARQLTENMKGGENDTNFAYGAVPVPVNCYSLLLARLEGEQPVANSSFSETREQLSQKVKVSPARADLLSNLAVVDALLGKKEEAIGEARRAAEMLPISKDALVGPGIVMNLAVVYAWTNELDLAFETLAPLAKIPNGIYYGQLKRDPYWEPLLQDPRYGKLLAELAPRD
jgi:serine/threonine protein kinase/Tfp pilus assembly protein PilF